MSFDEPVVLVAYDNGWPLRFEQEAARLRQRLGESVFGVEHIGSTAVPGLLAKPIVDMMVGVASPAGVEDVVRIVVPLGYEDCGGPVERRHLRKRGADSFNVHIVEHGGPLWRSNLDFRDYLHAHPEAAESYAAAKQRAAAAAPMLLGYSEAKERAITDLLELASREGRDTSANPPTQPDAE
jgi:GrpB-like predicted nucleotidyltransferase (UPF0157 family)